MSPHHLCYQSISDVEIPRQTGTFGKVAEDSVPDIAFVGLIEHEGCILEVGRWEPISLSVIL